MKILAPKRQGFLVQVSAFQYDIFYLLVSVTLFSLLKIGLVAKIENSFDDELAVLFILNFGNVPEK